MCVCDSFDWYARKLSPYLAISLCLSIPLSMLYLSIYRLLRSSNFLTLRKCCAAKLVPALVKVLRLPANLYLTLRKCCACHRICTSVPEAAKVPRRPRNLHLALPKCCACHAKLTSRKVRARSETVPSPFRTRAPGVATKVAFSQPETPTLAEGHSFS